MRELGSERIREKVVMKKMAPGVRRLYNAALPEIPKMIEMQRKSAEQIYNLQSKISNCQFVIGANAFMAIVKCDDPAALKAEYANKGVETETHFKHCIEWAEQFGYVEGNCSKAEELTKHLLMIPTYTKI